MKLIDAIKDELNSYVPCIKKMIANTWGIGLMLIAIVCSSLYVKWILSLKGEETNAAIVLIIDICAIAIPSLLYMWIFIFIYNVKKRLNPCHIYELIASSENYIDANENNLVFHIEKGSIEEMSILEWATRKEDVRIFVNHECFDLCFQDKVYFYSEKNHRGSQIIFILPPASEHVTLFIRLA